MLLIRCVRKREKPIAFLLLHTCLMSNIRFPTFLYDFDKNLSKFVNTILSMFAATRQRSIFSIYFKMR